jgi:hypothetical protein
VQNKGDEMKFFQHLWRATGLYYIPLAIVAWLVITDPDQGASTRDMLQNFATGLLAVTVAHVARKYLMPYLKLEKLIAEAMKGNIAAAIAFAGALIFTGMLVLMFAPRAHASEIDTYVPAGALKYGSILKAEQMRLWPDHANPAMLGALVEQESCITLHSARCWNPTSRNSAPKEEGAGMGQITRTWRVDGSLRFDSLADAKRLDPALSEWSWSNVYARPDLQLRAIVAMNRDCDRRMKSMVGAAQSRLELCDAAYNGGFGGMQQDRRACGQRLSCDPQLWFGNVEWTCTKSRVAAAGYRRGPCDINREHVTMVAKIRTKKYLPLLSSEATRRKNQI